MAFFSGDEPMPLRPFLVECTAQAEITERWRVMARSRDEAEEAVCGGPWFDGDKERPEVEFLEQVGVDHESDRELVEVWPEETPCAAPVWKRLLLAPFTEVKMPLFAAVVLALTTGQHIYEQIKSRVVTSRMVACVEKRQTTCERGFDYDTLHIEYKDRKPVYEVIVPPKPKHAPVDPRKLT